MMSPADFGPAFDAIHDMLGMERPTLGGDWQERDAP